MTEAERVPSGTARCCTEQVEKTGYEHSNDYVHMSYVWSTYVWSEADRDNMSPGNDC